MREREFEDILSRYPELIEQGLAFKGRQVNVRGKVVDLLFEDRHGQTLIVELKIGAIRREHVAQLLDYEGYFLSADNPTVRVMLVGNRVPNNLRRSLDHHGFEWKEIPTSHLIEFLREQNDEKMLSLIPDEEREEKSRLKKAKDDELVSKKAQVGNAEVFDTPVIQEISQILKRADIEPHIDPRIKRYEGNKPYIGIYRSPKRLYFTHFYEDGYLQAIVPKKMPPEYIETRYGIRGEGDVWDKEYRSATHYVLNIPYTIDNEGVTLINGKYRVSEKRDFFVDIARAR